jgi:serine/threonine protein kinase
MEKCYGENLKTFLLERTNPYPENPLYAPTKIALDYISAFCEIRRQMIMNRDIKSENIMVEILDSGEIRAKMIDLG